jgi:uncharacterized membrane protein YgcG
MYNAPDSIDPKSRQNIESIGTFAYGGGVGARIKVGKHVSFDAKYEIMQGGAVNMIDKYNSRLVGTDFLLNRRNIETNYGQFKVGVLFHLFEEKTKLEKVLEKEGYYKEEKQTYYVDPENSDKIIVPCDCGPCDNQTTAPSVRYLDEKLRWLDVLEMMGSGDDWNSSGSGDNWGSGSSGGGSSGGRGSTPSIKSGVGNH